MKKLMIAAASVAMAGAVFAEAQVHIATLTVTTTQCKSGKYTKAVDTFLGSPAGFAINDTVGYREKVTKKINGVFWGCDCTSVAAPDWGYLVNSKGKMAGVYGYAFWDATASTYVPYPVYRTTFQWLLLNRVSKLTDVEGAWTLKNVAAGNALQLWGAGYGTAAGSTWAADCGDAYIKNMSGNFAGWMLPAIFEGGDGCIFCGETDYGCIVLPFCTCGIATGSENVAAAYGTWTLKYNAQASKEMKSKSFITKVPTLKMTTAAFKNVKAHLEIAFEAVKDAATAAGHDKKTTASTNVAYPVALATIEANWDTAKEDIVDEVSASILPKAIADALHLEGDDDEEIWGDDDADDDYDDDSDDDIWG